MYISFKKYFRTNTNIVVLKLQMNSIELFKTGEIGEGNGEWRDWDIALDTKEAKSKSIKQKPIKPGGSEIKKKISVIFYNLFKTEMFRDL